MEITETETQKKTNRGRIKFVWLTVNHCKVFTRGTYVLLVLFQLNGEQKKKDVETSYLSEIMCTS